VMSGRSIAGWARENGFKRHLVYFVLRGGRALRGESHHIAVALKIKNGVPRLGRSATAHASRR